MLVVGGDAVYTINLTKIYGNGVEALRDVNIRIRENTITSILGPNGAGKTTLLRILSTQLQPTSGEAYVLGYNVVYEADRIRRHIAVVPQEGRPVLMVTPWDEIYFGARIRGFSRDEARRRTIEILKLLDLYDVKDRKIIKLSGGQKQKVLIGRTLVSDADILFLDEPTIGLDPISRRRIWSDIVKLRDMGKTILLTTHYMDEAEALSDYIYIIHEGRIIAGGRVDELKSLIDVPIIVYVEGGDQLDIDNIGCEVSRIGNKLLLKPRDRVEALELVKYALEKGIRIEVRPPSLEDVFLSLVGGDGFEG